MQFASGFPIGKIASGFRTSWVFECPDFGHPLCVLYLHSGRLFSSTFGAKPFSFWFVGQLYTCEVEPLYRAQIVVTTNHLTIRDLQRN